MINKFYEDRFNIDNVSKALVSYTSKDYESIKKDLINSIEVLSKDWTSRSDDDPGIILIKLISQLGDMLFYNLDKNALEVYPDTVKQRKNAQQLFKLMGYKMSWYRSSIIDATIHNNTNLSFTIPAFSKFSDAGGTIYYTNLVDTLITGNASNRDIDPIIQLVQGVPVTPPLLNSSIVINPDINKPWHSIYDYNLKISDIENDKYYLNDVNIESTLDSSLGETIILIDDDSDLTHTNYWTQVDNVLLSTDSKTYELCTTYKDEVYIKFKSNFTDIYPKITKFKLFYIKSDGINGRVNANIITKLVSSIDNADVKLSDIAITHPISEGGFNPESVNDAKNIAPSYVNTFDTLVTCDDFTRFVKRLPGVGLCLVTDYMTDPSLLLESYKNSYYGKIYIIRNSNYSTYMNTLSVDANIDDLYKQNILNLVNPQKHIFLDLDVFLENDIDIYFWELKGEVYLYRPITIDSSYQFITKINEVIRYLYAPENREFNKRVKYAELIDDIKSVDDNIDEVDLDKLTYYKPKREKYGKVSYETLQLNTETNNYDVYINGELTEMEVINDATSDKDGYYHNKRTSEYLMNHIANWRYGLTLVELGYNLSDTDYLGTKPLPSTPLSSIIYIKDNPSNTNYPYTANTYDGEHWRSPVEVKTTDINFQLLYLYDLPSGLYYDSQLRLYNRGDVILDSKGNYEKIYTTYRDITGSYEQLWRWYDNDVSYTPQLSYNISLGLDSYHKNSVGEYDYPLISTIYPDYYGDDFKPFPIKPKSVLIYIEDGKYLITDNGSGKLVNGDNIMDSLGSIDYETGKLSFTLSITPSTDIRIQYTVNKIAFAMYKDLSTINFKVADDSIIKGRVR